MTHFKMTLRYARYAATSLATVVFWPRFFN